MMVGTCSWSIVSRTPRRTLEKKIPSITSTLSSFTSFWTCWIAVAGLFASSASTNWILRPPIRPPRDFTYATNPRLTSIDGALLGPLKVRRFPIFSGFIADFFAIPAHAPDDVASGKLASATPAPARLRNSRRSSDPAVLSSLTLSPSVARLRDRTYNLGAVVVKILGQIVANLVDGTTQDRLRSADEAHSDRPKRNYRPLDPDPARRWLTCLSR